MKYIKKLLKLILILFLFILSLPLLLYIPLFYDRNFYKNQITENVEKFSDYKLELQELDLSIYPYLKLNLKNIDLRTKEKDIPLLKLEELNLSIFFLGFLGNAKLDIDDISLRNGFIDIPAFLNSIPESKEEVKTETNEPISKDLIDFLHNRLQIKQILLENIEIQIKPFHSSIYHNPKIKEIKLSYNSFLDSKFFLDIDYGKTNITLTGTAGIFPEQLDLQSLFFKAELTAINLPIYEYSHYLKKFPAINTIGSNLNLKLKTKKENDKMLLENTLDIAVNHLGYKNKENVNKRITPITLRGNIDYPLFTKGVQTKNLNLTLGNLFHLKLDSDLNFSYRPIIRANLNSSFVNISPILDFVEAFSKSAEETPSKQKQDQKPEKDPSIFVDLKYNANRISFENLYVNNFFLYTNLKDTALNYRVGIRKLADGNLYLSGEANLQNGISANGYLEIENVNMEKLTTQFLGKKMAEGTLVTYVKFQTDNKYGEKDFLKNLSLTGSTNLKDGVLLDRADILYPVRFLNKIIPSEDKLNTNISRFNFIDIDYTVKNQRFKVKNLNIQGKIFNTTGNADIGLDNPSEDIHANLVVSTSIAGAGLKIPMVYSKSSYVPFSIDKVWLASVYTGMAVGGPVGAMIGSVLSERAGDAFKTIKNKSEETFKENTENIFSK